MTDKTAWSDFFDDHAPVYHDNCFTKNTVAEVDFLVQELGLAPGATLLDVGCGTGRHDIELARRGYAVTGIDLSKGMLDLARKGAREAGVSITFRQADAASFTMNAQFDAAICLCEGAFGLLGSPDDAIAQPLAILRNIAAAMKPTAKCMFTVLSAFRTIRAHTQEDVEQKRFDALTLTEVSEFTAPGETGPKLLRERAFVPTELNLLFALAGLKVLHMGGGTAGNWGKRPIDLDEYEIMVIAHKPA